MTHIIAVERLSPRRRAEASHVGVPPQPGQAWPGGKILRHLVEVTGKLLRLDRSWSDQAHVPPQNVEQLRKPLETRQSQSTSKTLGTVRAVPDGRAEAVTCERSAPQPN